MLTGFKFTCLLETICPKAQDPAWSAIVAPSWEDPVGGKTANGGKLPLYMPLSIAQCRLFKNYLLFFLWRFLRSLFFRLCVAILCLLRFFPHGIVRLLLNVKPFYFQATCLTDEGNDYRKIAK
jgi:hypothetical protein